MRKSFKALEQWLWDLRRGEGDSEAMILWLEEDLTRESDPIKRAAIQRSITKLISRLKPVRTKTGRKLIRYAAMAVTMVVLWVWINY